jgi:translocation protein SEC66
VPDSVLRAALLRRAVEDINRIVQVRTAKQACSTLLQRGSVGDDLWQRFLRAEKEMEEELRDVVLEVRKYIPFDRQHTNLSQANALAPNWGQTIFQSAHEIAANTALRDRLGEIQAQTQAEKEWWEKRRVSIQTDLMREIGTPAATPAAKSLATPSKTISDEDTVIVENPTPSDKGSTKKKKGKK